MEEEKTAEIKDINILSVQDLIKTFKKRVKNDFDVVVGVTGEEGIGKSSLATWCVIESLLYDGATREEAILRFPEYTIFSPNKDRVKEQITKAEKYSLVNADESIKILYKLNWNSDIQKFLNMLYALCRKENKITLLCMPRFTDFNEYFRKHRIKFWIHVIDRGVGAVFVKDWNPFTDDPWWMKEGMDIIKNNTGRGKMVDFNTHDKIRMMSKVRNFVGIIEFPDLDTDIKKIYKKGKEDFGYEDMETGDIGAGKRAELYQDRIETTAVNLMNKGMTTKEICEITNTPKRTICTYLSRARANAQQPIFNNNQLDDENFADLKEVDNK